eukprot:gene11344-13193_t
MEEVEGFLDGERDYTKIQGNTGPLVYPAGFLYIFTVLRWATNNGTNIFAAQCIFGVIYILTQAVVMALYAADGWALAIASVLLLLSKRIHSIYMLRLFNDCIAVLCGYFAILLFTRKNWRTGCFFYSIGVSVKMNMLLYAPGVLLVLLMGTGYVETIVCLSICAGVQLVLGYPFLSTYPKQYLMKSFELNRVFTYKWTVNFKFLPEDVFVAKPLSILLLVLTVIAFVAFAAKWITEINAQLRSYHETKGKEKKAVNFIGLKDLSSKFIITTIFVSNFIGVVFARTLHYQFYCWYFHTLPYLLWHCMSGTSSVFNSVNKDGYSVLWAIVCVGLSVVWFVAVEVCFNVFPATAWSSALLQVCHLVLLVGLYRTPVPWVAPALTSAEAERVQKKDKAL